MNEAAEPANIHLLFGPYGISQLIVNEQDITANIEGVQFSSAMNSVPVLNVLLKSGPMEIKGPGIVKVNQSGVSKEEVVNFLKTLDGKAIELMALNDGDMSSSVGDGFLETIIKLIEDSL